MNTKEIISEYLIEQFNQGRNKGFTVSEISSALKIWNTDAASALKALVEAGTVTKTGSRPILYFPARGQVEKDVSEDRTTVPEGDDIPFSGKTISSPEKSAFHNIIGFDGSLKEIVRTAQAAVLYPPYGLHTLILGETGVGKSMFAGQMWQFAKEHSDVLQRNNIPFVTMNCAEYADNPQLLLSYLFGHVKGSFTGADSSRDGLVSEANGGILFLDEVHRLPDTGQEMLFQLIDQGQYHRLGDPKTSHASLMLIAATTEMPKETLLSTFMRRIPVTLKIPPLFQRPFKERLSIIRNLYLAEAKLLKRGIYVKEEVLKTLLSYRFNANIGDLRKVITLSCASSFVTYTLSGASGELIINPRNLGNLDEYGVLLELTVSEQLYLEKHISGGIHLNFDTGNDSGDKTEDSVVINYKYHIQSVLDQNDGINLTKAELYRHSEHDLETLHEQYYRQLSGLSQNSKSVLSMLAPNITEAVEYLLKEAALFFGRTYSIQETAVFALHLEQALKRSAAGTPLINPKLVTGNIRTREEYDFIKAHREKFTSILGTRLSDDELSYCGIFLAQKAVPKTPRVGLILAAFGKDTASSLSAFVSRILGIAPITSIALDLDESPKEIEDELLLQVDHVNQGQGVLILCPENALPFDEHTLSEKTGCECRIFEQIGSAYIIEAAKMSNAGIYSLEDISSHLEDLFWKNVYKRSQKKGSIPYIQSEKKKGLPTILTVSSAGINEAVQIKQLIQKKIPCSVNTAIIPLENMDTIREFADHYNDLIYIVGDYKPEIPGIAFLPSYVLEEEEGPQRFNVLLMQKMSTLDPSPMIISKEEKQYIRIHELLKKKVSSFAPNLPGEKLLLTLDIFIHEIQGLCGSEKVFSPGQYLCFFTHMITLFSRAKDNCCFDMSPVRREINEILSPYAEIMHEALLRPSKEIGVSVPLSESYNTLLVYAECLLPEHTLKELRQYTTTDSSGN